MRSRRLIERTRLRLAALPLARRTSRALITLALIVTLAPPAAAAPRTPIRIAMSNALVGRFTSPRCDAGDVDAQRGDPASAPVRRESLFEQLSARFEGARRSRDVSTVAFDAGDLLGTSAIGKLAIEHDPKALAAAVSVLGIRGLSLGHRDLAAPRAMVLAMATALDEISLSYSLSNLRCSDAGRDLCDRIINADDPPLIIEEGDQRIAFISAIAPTVFAHAGKDLTAGLTLLPPAEALSVATKQARGMGATLVVAAYDPALGAELEDALKTALAIDPEASPDLLFVSGISGQVRTAVTAVGNTTLVATQPASVVVGQRNDSDAIFEAPAAAQPDGRISSYSRELNRAICESFAKPYVGGALSAPMDRETLGAFVLDVMRERAHTEVALINQLALSTRAPFPFEGRLTPLMLMQALPFDNELRVAHIRGAVLKGLLEAPQAKWMYFRGAEQVGGVWKVNGRPLDVTQFYGIVTTNYIADGGDELMLDKGIEFESITRDGDDSGVAAQPDTVRKVLDAWLSEPHEGDIRTLPVDLSERTRWLLSYRLQLDLTNVAIYNPAPDIFTDTQLARGGSLSVVGETEFRAIGDHPAYAFENQVRLRFGMLRTTTFQGAETNTVNNVDIATSRSLFFYRRLFNKTPKWYEPRPYADVYIETELTKPDTRSFHHLFLLPTAGLRFEITPLFALYVGGGLFWEVFARPEEMVPVAPNRSAVLVAGWQLRPIRLAQIGLRFMEAESNLDFVVRDIGFQTQAQTRFRVRLVIPIFSIVSLTTTYDMYLRYVRVSGAGGDWVGNVGYAGDIYVGLQIGYSHALQAFAL